SAQAASPAIITEKAAATATPRRRRRQPSRASPAAISTVIPNGIDSAFGWNMMTPSRPALARPASMRRADDAPPLLLASLHRSPSVPPGAVRWTSPRPRKSARDPCGPAPRADTDSLADSPHSGVSVVTRAMRKDSDHIDLARPSAGADQSPMIP